MALSLVVALTPSSNDYYAVSIASILVFKMLWVINFQPYQKERWNHAQLVSDFCALLIFFNALLYTSNQFLNQTVSPDVFFMVVNIFCVFYFLGVSYYDTKAGRREWWENPTCCCWKLRRNRDLLVSPSNLTLDTLVVNKSEDSESSPCLDLPTNEIQMIPTPASKQNENKYDFHTAITHGKMEEELPPVIFHTTSTARLPRRLAVNLTPSQKSDGSMNFNSPSRQKSSDSDTPINGLPGGVETGEFPVISED